MSKKVIGIIVGAVLVVGLAITLVVLNNLPPEESESTPAAEAINVLKAPEGAFLKSATVTNAEGGFGIETEIPADATTPNYLLKGYEDYPVASSLGSFGRNLAALTAKSVVSEGGDKAPFGLDKPAATVAVAYDDGTTATLYIGNAAPGNEGYYVSTGGDAIYLVTSSLVSAAFNQPMAFMDKTVTGGDPEATTVLDAELGGTVRPEPIVLEPVAEGSDEATMMVSHLITSPISVGADSQYGLEALRGAFGISADEVVGTAGDDEALEEYGLLEPYSTIRLTPAEDSGLAAISLKASAPDGEGNVYLMNGESDLVYKVAASALPWLDVQLFDMMSKLVILPYIDKVSAVTVETPDESHTFQVSGEGDEMVVTHEGETLDSDLFRKLYQELIGARYEELIGAANEADDPAAEDSQAAGSQPADSQAAGDSGTVTDDAVQADGQPESPPEGDLEPESAAAAALGQIPEDAELLMTFTYEYRDGKTPDVVSFYAGPTRRAYIQLNGGQPYLTQRGYVDSILPNIQRLLKGEKIETYLF